MTAKKKQAKEQNGPEPRPCPYPDIPRPPLLAGAELVSVPEALDIFGRLAYPKRWPEGWREETSGRTWPRLGWEKLADDDLPALVLGGLVHLLNTGRIRSVAVWPEGERPPVQPGVLLRRYVELDADTWRRWYLFQSADNGTKHVEAIAVDSWLLVDRLRPITLPLPPERPPPLPPERLHVLVVASDVEAFRAEQEAVVVAVAGLTRKDAHRPVIEFGVRLKFERGKLDTKSLLDAMKEAGRIGELNTAAYAFGQVDYETPNERVAEALYQVFTPDGTKVGEPLDNETIRRLVLRINNRWP